MKILDKNQLEDTTQKGKSDKGFTKRLSAEEFNNFNVKINKDKGIELHKIILGNNWSDAVFHSKRKMMIMNVNEIRQKLKHVPSWMDSIRISRRKLADCSNLHRAYRSIK